MYPNEDILITMNMAPLDQSPPPTGADLDPDVVTMADVLANLWSQLVCI